MAGVACRQARKLTVVERLTEMVRLCEDVRSGGYNRPDQVRYRETLWFLLKALIRWHLHIMKGKKRCFCLSEGHYYVVRGKLAMLLREAVSGEFRPDIRFARFRQELYRYLLGSFGGGRLEGPIAEALGYRQMASYFLDCPCFRTLRYHDPSR